MPEGSIVGGVRDLPEDTRVVTTTLSLSDGDTNVNVPGLSSIDHVVAQVEENQGTDMVQVAEGNAGTIDVTMVAIADGSSSANTNDCTVIAVGQ